MTFNVEPGISLRITKSLSLFQAFGEGHLVLLHPGKDVIAGAVENAINALERITGHTFAQSLDDRNGAAHCGFEIERNVFAFGNRRKLDAVAGEQCFVGSHHRFAGRQRRLGRALGWLAGPANQLNEDINAGFASERHWIGEPSHLLEIDAAISRTRAGTNRNDLDDAATASGQCLTLAGNLGNQGGTDRAQSGDTNFQRLRAHDLYPSTGLCPRPESRICFSGSGLGLQPSRVLARVQRRVASGTTLWSCSGAW